MAGVASRSNMSARDRAEALLAKGGLSHEVERIIRALINEIEKLRAECDSYLAMLNDGYDNKDIR